MKFSRGLKRLAVVWSCSLLLARAAETPLKLWPAGAPGPKFTSGPEADTSQSGKQFVEGKPVIRLGNVSEPELTFYPAAASGNTHSAVLVFPGGGYQILAYDLEGTEICAWLNSLGVNAVLVKYRVPGSAADGKDGMPRYQAPLEDAQRAMGLTREHAAKWNIDADRIGVLGFSAGAHLAAALSDHNDERTYPAVDEADRLSSRPNFVVLVYPGYLSKGSVTEVRPEVTPSKNTAPTILIQAEDDPVHVENSLAYYWALKQAGAEATMHLFPKGGHGYGLRPSNLEVSHWPEFVAQWMRQSGWLKP